MLILVSPTLNLRSETSNFPHIWSLVTGYVLVCFVIYWRKSVDCVMVEIFSYWVFFGSESQIYLSSCKHLRFFGYHLNSRHANVLLWFLELFCSPHSLALVRLFRTAFWWSTTIHCPQIPSSKCGKTSSSNFIRISSFCMEK